MTYARQQLGAGASHCANELERRKTNVIAALLSTRPTAGGSNLVTAVILRQDRKEGRSHTRTAHTRTCTHAHARTYKEHETNREKERETGEDADNDAVMP